MVFPLTRGRLASAAAEALQLLPAVLTLAALATVMAFLAWTYVAQPEHPEGICYESRGRPMPCFELDRRRAASH